MTNSERPVTTTSWAQASYWLSVVLPGSGQFLAGKRWRAAVIFLAVVFSAFLVNWALTVQSIGQITIAGQVTSWLWLPWFGLWVWNVFDARRSAVGKGANAFLGILLTAFLLYLIAWNVTDIHLDRLVTRFNDARAMSRQLINPELATVTVNGEDQICSFPCLFTYFGDKIAGRTSPNPVRVSDNLLDIFGRVGKIAAPAWMVRLGLTNEQTTFPNYVAGTMMETIAIGLMGTIFSTILALPVSFLAAHNIMSRLRGGNVVYYVVRTLLNIVRAVDTLVWGLIIVIWIGLGSFAGVIALTIHSVAALGKLFSEEIEHIDPGPVEALTATGANLVQTIRYGVIPQIIPSFLAYSLLRWDINMRSATILGFVAGGGIGFFVVETIRAGGYQLYATALWVVAIMIILVDYISARWRENILADQPAVVTPRHPKLVKARTTLYIVLGAAAFIYFWNVAGISIKALLQPAPTFWDTLREFVTIDLSPDVLQLVIKQLLVTIFQALLATTLGAILAMPFSFLGAKNLTGRSPVLTWIYYLTRSVFNILRSIEALLYVAIFIAWVGIGAFAGMLALAVTTFALLGKLFSEAIENIESGPIEAVTASGANRLQVIAYAILPQIVPPFVSYLIYQWDINIRMATIIGFAGGGGIGLTLTSYFGLFQNHQAGTVVAFIVLVVALMDFASAKIREQLV